MAEVQTDRRELLLAGVQPETPGLEFGPGYSPLVTREAGYNVRFVDHADQSELRTKYRDHAVDIEQIPEIDFVYKGQSFSELFGQERFKWIVASHVLEHVPDLLGFLKGCSEILDDDGVLTLALPDRRRCFDYYRPVTGLAAVVNAHYEGRTKTSIGTWIEFVRRAASVDGAIIWNGLPAAHPSFLHPIDAIGGYIEDIVERGAYYDCHVWVFTPSSFRLLIADLAATGLCPLKEHAFFAPENSGEFFIQLSRAGSVPPDLQLLALQALAESAPAELRPS